mmetsp:Transcript_6309/g.9709  ORF Transcript_6309/g.9709 Transcript_6309/m.9709 type:complete len:97 (+) Transcript_6309:838-1128(+)|eukprot:CAMPEP_0178910192 /NCGR_PEP_ID=MMETSP0786-20121207/8957_1 /TAXON_ID=186022 /ORGANISM="Thalassionema frauenfeldii, Strain CCMP 1798" /LENGTH=96 /DNA_ID=CAMNT_0020582409 /DNA_START=766 /DNA_END=1056 /DNA_ORIENTATION=+
MIDGVSNGPSPRTPLFMVGAFDCYVTPDALEKRSLRQSLQFSVCAALSTIGTRLRSLKSLKTTTIAEKMFARSKLWPQGNAKADRTHHVVRDFLSP